MRVTNNSFSLTLSRQLQALSQQQFKYLNQVSTGQRINKISDDPAAVGRVLDIQNEKRDIAQYERNANRAEEMSNVTYAGISQINKINVRAQEIASLTNTELNNDQMHAYAEELKNLVEQVVSVGNTRHLGENIFGGDATDTDPFTVTRDGDGKITAVAYGGATTDSPLVDIAEGTSVRLYQDHSVNEQFQSLMTDLISLRDALDSKNAAQVKSLQPSLATHEENLVNATGNVSASLLRIEFSRSQNTETFGDLESKLSNAADADITDTIVKLTQVRTAYQAAIQSSGQVLQQSLLNYL